MAYTRYSNQLVATLVVVFFLTTTAAYALIDLEWRPACQSVDPGEMVEIDLYAVSDDETDQSIAAMDVILLWDPTVIELIGVDNSGLPYEWIFSGFQDDSGLDGLNDTWLDGNALYTALAQFGIPAYATPEGLKVTTLQFNTVVDLGFTSIQIIEDAGSYSHTRVFDGEIPGLDVYGLSGQATAGVGNFGLIYAYLSCTPTSGTLPFITNFMVVLGSNYEDQFRRLGGRIDLTLASGTFYSSFRAGYTNLSPKECYAASWNQNIPALGTLVGDNIFTLLAEDVTPPPYNQPPFAPSGMTDSDVCTITGMAP